MDWEKERNKIIGLGEQSFRKNYYPDLQEKIDELEKAYGSLETILSSMSDAIVVHDAEGGLLYLNKQATELFNIEANAYAQYSLDSLLSFEGHFEDFADVLKRAESQKQTITGGFVFQRGNQGKIPVQVSINKTNWHGKPAFVAVLRDFTELMEAEQALRDSERKYKNLFDYSPIGIYQSTPEGKILNANKSLLKMLEFESLNDLKKWNLNVEGYAKEASISRNDFVAMIEEEGYVLGLEEIWVTKNGKQITVRENARAIRGADGKTFMYEGTVEDITGSKRIQEELRLSQEQYALAVEGSNDGLWDWNLDTDEIYFSERWKNMIGYQDHELENKFNMWIDLLHPADRERSVLAVEQYLKGEIPIYDIEFRLRHKNGGYRWMRDRGKALRRKDGSPYRMAGSQSDITYLKEVEREAKNLNQNLEQRVKDRTMELQGIKNRLEFLLTSAPLVIYSVSAKPPYVFSFIGGNIQRLMGYNPSDLIGKEGAWFAKVHPDDLGALEKRLTEMPNIGQLSHEYRFMFLDGTYHWLQDESILIKDPQGNSKEALGYWIDVTERKKSEEEFRHLFSLSDTALELTKAGFWEVPMDGSGYYNQSDRGTSIYGMHPTKDKRYLLSDWYDGVRAADELIAERVMQEYLAASTEEIDKYDVVHPFKRPVDGEMIWVHALGIMRQDADGMKFMDGVVQDITELKMTEKSLVAAKEAAEAATQAKSEFLANMSHEIRTPMNAIIGFSELLARTITEKKRQSQIESIRTSGKNLLSIINDILDLSKIEAGRLEIELSPVNVLDLVKEIKNMFALRIEEKGIAFEIEVEGAFPNALMLDEVRMRQVIFNLVGNAVKFTEKGWVKLGLNAEGKGEAPEFYDLELYVEDTGIGIRQDQLERIFEPFNQQKGQSTAKYGGTGLGLSITKKLIERMGGSILVASQVDKGSRFSIMLPSLEASQQEIQTSPKAFDPTSVVFAPAKILIADDNPENRKLIMDLFDHCSMSFFEAADGKEALETAMEYLPDIILMDLRMPRIDGYQATKLLKDNSNTRAIPVIAVSASVKNYSKASEELSLFDDFILKPLDIAKLFEVLKKYLKYEEHHKQSIEDEQKTRIRLTKTQRRQLPVLINSLEKDFLPKHQEIVKKQRIDEIESFGQSLQALGNQFQIEKLKTYGEEILALTNNFEVDKLMKALTSFPGIVEKLKTFPE